MIEDTVQTNMLSQLIYFPAKGLTTGHNALCEKFPTNKQVRNENILYNSLYK